MNLFVSAACALGACQLTRQMFVNPVMINCCETPTDEPGNKQNFVPGPLLQFREAQTYDFWIGSYTKFTTTDGKSDSVTTWRPVKYVYVDPDYRWSFP